MKKDHVYNYSFAENYKEIEAGFVAPPQKDDDVIDISNAFDSFIRIVYSRHPVYKVPTGDIQYLVSDKANPEVKQWILDNIMLDTSSAATPMAPRGLSDDDIASLARNSHEDVRAYCDRINKFMVDNKSAYERMVSYAKASMGKKQDVSSEPK